MNRPSSRTECQELVAAFINPHQHTAMPSVGLILCAGRDTMKATSATAGLDRGLCVFRHQILPHIVAVLEALHEGHSFTPYRPARKRTP
jgi:hypothetical protein